MDVEIIVEVICAAFQLPLATEIEVRSHTYNVKEFWGVIKNASISAENMPSKGKKKDLLSPLYERVLDILYKCLESRVAAVDDVNFEKLALMHVVLFDYKCDWVMHIYNCLEYFINKVGVKDGDKELEVYVGYGFMLSYLLKLKGVLIGKGSEVHPNAYLFKPSKKSKVAATASETSVSSIAPLQALLEEKKKFEGM